MELYRLPTDEGASGHVVGRTANKASSYELNITAFATLLIGRQRHDKGSTGREHQRSHTGCPTASIH